MDQDQNLTLLTNKPTDVSKKTASLVEIRYRNPAGHKPLSYCDIGLTDIDFADGELSRICGIWGWSLVGNHHLTRLLLSSLCQFEQPPLPEGFAADCREFLTQISPFLQCHL